jgi:hypothetical protein
MESNLRNTGTTCEWKYPWDANAVCGKELTQNELNYCETHMEELNGQALCYGHQKQYLDQKGREEKGGYESVKNYEESNPGSLK